MLKIIVFKVIYFFSIALGQNISITQSTNHNVTPTDHNIRALLHECLRIQLYEYYDMSSNHIGQHIVCNEEDIELKNGVLVVPHQTFNNYFHWAIKQNSIEVMDSIEMSSYIQNVQFNFDLPVEKRDFENNKFIFKENEIAFYVFSDMFLGKNGYYYISLTYGNHLCMWTSAILKDDEVFKYLSHVVTYEIERCEGDGRFRIKKAIFGSGERVIESRSASTIYEIKTSKCWYD